MIVSCQSEWNIGIFHERKKNPKVKCDICQKTFGQMNDLETHIICVHNKKKGNICNNRFLKERIKHTL